MKLLIGHTGFVGSNLAQQTRFDGLYHSRTVNEAFGTTPDLLVYAGVRAEKFLANNDPEADQAVIAQAIANIEAIRPRKIVLISTVDVYEQPDAVDESDVPDARQPYGKHRAALENWVREHIDDHLIVRLPALFGRNIKKNFLYDMLHPVPSALTAAKFSELTAKEPQIASFYADGGNGFFKRNALDASDQVLARTLFARTGFSALHFTDSRASYQFYGLDRLWSDITAALDAGLSVVNLATEPITAGELYERLMGTAFRNEFAAQPARYDFRTRHATAFGKTGPYIADKEEVLAHIGRFFSNYDL